MERGSRRLLHDLDALGRVFQDRLPAWKRLELEVGPLLARALLPVEGPRPSAKPGRTRRDVA
jgi:hypothetical protein